MTLPFATPATVFVLYVAAWGCVSALGVGIGAFAFGRWRLAAALGRAATLAGPVVFAASVVAFVVVPGSRADPVFKATVLSVGISHVINCDGLALLATFPSAVLWRAGRRRAEAASPPRERR
jgi:hypothetical protein